MSDDVPAPVSAGPVPVGPVGVGHVALGPVTVGHAAACLGVTVRTLHHWHRMGLAVPSSRSPAGYRLYTAHDIERLRRVIVYRELGVDLEGIRRILDDPDADVVATLRSQRAELKRRIARLRALDDDLERMTRAQENGLLMTPSEQAAVFGPGWDPQWPAAARERYGDTAQWRQYAERSASRTAADWGAIAEASADLDRTLGEAHDAGVEPGSDEADALVERHRAVLSAYFPISRRMQVVLGRLYEADSAYAAHYDAIRPGLAAWLRRLIDAAARTHGIDPETAAWEDDAASAVPAARPASGSWA